jgi:N-acetylglucosamine-6-phosphate deacetylase
VNTVLQTVYGMFDRGLRPAGQLPVEVHCHGLGEVDFSDLAAFDLDSLEAACAAEGVHVVPTLYLHRDSLGAFEAMMADYAARRADGELAHIAGMALEGPLLASHGGTPAATVWLPELREWERLAALGSKGLLYSVMSPDAFTGGSGLAEEIRAGTPRFEDFVPLLVSSGVRPALGHFTREDPVASADMTEHLIELAWSGGWNGPGFPVVTDHLFNDMPLNIRHAFRTTRARATRGETIARYRLPEWTLDRIDEIAGPVPGAIMRNAKAGRLAACINFDGEHVDLEIAKRAIELMGTEHAMIMTDRCDSARLGGQRLHHELENALWYQHDGVVAAGSQPLSRQVINARDIGFADAEIWQLIAGTAHQALGLSAPGADPEESGA